MTKTTRRWTMARKRRTRMRIWRKSESFSLSSGVEITLGTDSPLH